jgi:hypothetical protein
MSNLTKKLLLQKLSLQLGQIGSSCLFPELTRRQYCKTFFFAIDALAEQFTVYTFILV